MERLATNYHRLSGDQRIGLTAVCVIAFTTSLCVGASCTANSNLLTGAGIGGAIGFALAGVCVAALLGWGIENQQNDQSKELLE